MNDRKVVVLLSGGLDSTTLIAYAIESMGVQPTNILGLILRYGQRHDKEVRSAWDVIEYYGIRGSELDLSIIFGGLDSSMLRGSSKELPQMSYAEQLKALKGQPVSTYVPFRNSIFLSVATARAMYFGADTVLYGAHADDAAGTAYPDCTPEFVTAMNDTMLFGTGYAVRLVAPFILKNKADIVRLGLSFGVPYRLTWSCYAGGVHACGKCGTCRDRLEAFRENDVEDPIIYHET